MEYDTRLGYQPNFKYDILARGIPYIICSAGALGSMLTRIGYSYENSPVLILDNDIKLIGKRIHGTTVKSFDWINGNSEANNFFYVIANKNNYDSIINQLKEYGIDNKRIIVYNDETLISYDYHICCGYREKNKYFIFDVPQKRGTLASIQRLSKMLRCAIYKAQMRTLKKTPNVQSKHNVTICAIFKNEARYLKEWIEYHQIVGVDHFYLYNNDSNDNYESVLGEYIDSGIVTLVDWPGNCKQIPAYIDCAFRFRNQANWIGFIDIDEFIVPNKYRDIGLFLIQFENRGSVLVYWKFFGSTGLVDRDRNGLVTEDFYVSWDRFTDIGKCFYNTKYDLVVDDKKNGLHHFCWTKVGSKEFPPVNVFDHICLPEINIVNSGDMPIQINHYYTKSYKEYIEKIQKGDVFFEYNSHSLDAFFYHDGKAVSSDYSIYKYLIELKERLKKRN